MFVIAEPRVRRSQGTAWEPEDTIPYSFHDGAWQTDYHTSQVGVLRVSREYYTGQEVLYSLQGIHGPRVILIFILYE